MDQISDTTANADGVPFWKLPAQDRARLLAQADAAELAVVQHDRRVIEHHENEE